MRKIILAFLAAAATAQADPPLNKTVDFSASTAPALQVYQANTRTIQWTLKNNNATVSGAGYTPVMWIASSNRASQVVTAACSWVSQTGGTFSAVFSPAMLNTNGSWVYGVGILSNDMTTARQGAFVISADPYAAGAGAVAFTSILNWGLLGGYTNTASAGPYLAGSNITFRAATSGRVYLDAAGGIETDPIWTADKSKYATNGANVSVFVNDADYSSTNAHAALVGPQAHGLKDASTNYSSAFATAAQGSLASTAIQRDGSVTWTGTDHHGGYNIDGVSELHGGPAGYLILKASNSAASVDISDSGEVAIYGTNAVGFQNGVGGQFIFRNSYIDFDGYPLSNVIIQASSIPGVITNGSTFTGNVITATSFGGGGAGISNVTAIGVSGVQSNIISAVSGFTNATATWDGTWNTVSLAMPDGTSLQLGQEQCVVVRNTSGYTITNGKVCATIAGAGIYSGVKLADPADDWNNSLSVIGVATMDITNNTVGKITTLGNVNGIDSTAFEEGSNLWLHAAIPGELTMTMPTNAAKHQPLICQCLRKNAGDGRYLINVQKQPHAEDIGAVATTATNGWTVSSHAGFVTNITGTGFISTTNGGEITLTIQASAQSPLTNHVNMASYSMTNGSFVGNGLGLTNIVDGRTITNLPSNSGFENPYAAGSMGFSNANRSWYYWTGGTNIRYTVQNRAWYTATNMVVQIPDIEGLHYIYFDANSGQVTNSMTEWTIVAGEAQIAMVYWDKVSQQYSYLGDERHGKDMDSTTHADRHFNEGAHWWSVAGQGVLLHNAQANIATSPGANGSNSCVAIRASTIWDDDHTNATAALGTSGSVLTSTNDAANFGIMYATGAVATVAWRTNGMSAFPFMLDPSGTRPMYNSLTAGIWSTNVVTEKNYFISWIVQIPRYNDGVGSGFVLIPDSFQSSTLTGCQARTYANILENRTVGITEEMKPLYRIINYYQAVGGQAYPAAVKYTKIVEVQDLRAGNNNPAVSLSGAQVDYSQFALLDGARTYTGTQNLGNNSLTNVLTVSTTNLILGTQAVTLVTMANAMVGDTVPYATSPSSMAWTNSPALNGMSITNVGYTRQPRFQVALSAPSTSIIIQPTIFTYPVFTNSILDNFNGYSTNTGRYTIPTAYTGLWAWGGQICVGYGSTQNVAFGLEEILPTGATNRYLGISNPKCPYGNYTLIFPDILINYTGGVHQVFPVCSTDIVTNWITNISGRTWIKAKYEGAL